MFYETPGHVMLALGSTLVEQADHVYARVMEAQVTDRDRDSYRALFNTLSNDIVGSPKQAPSPIRLKKGKKAIEEQRGEHSAQAIRCVAEVHRSFWRHLSTATSPVMRSSSRPLLAIYYAILTHLIEAERHAVALDILANLEDKYYRRGDRPPPVKEQDKLIVTMAKSLLYNEVALRKDQNKAKTIDRVADRLLALNNTCPVITYSRDELVQCLTNYQSQLKLT